MELMTAIFAICGGVVNTVMGSVGGSISTAATLPTEIVTVVESLGLLESIPLWLVSLLSSLFITIMSFILLLTVYGRFFRLYLYTALAPLPLASFAGEGTSASGKAFLKSYIGVCMEGAADASLSAVSMVWQYVGQLIFNMLILTGLVKGADRIVKEMLGL